ncbi:aminotransferase-like domain-containing protein [Rhizobium miluonense]|uniref:DNA-binding transcriptional regulator, MocR family, contains an aminotransferase domain n=1 Tax=Rhizobium miluonense TaxID=411945 RepID=A0A1C3WZY9_9HYPH|nr:PLP-dependent aminotransferase family protein [Rhizobium miluonense]SCB45597.1 DNA-binding transcriptional regulator, MocR family, contains an aminotransferase domain [Rhizobium miluonense]
MNIQSTNRPVERLEQHYIPPHGLLNMSGNLPPQVPHVFDAEYRAAMEVMMADHSPMSLIGAHQFRGVFRDRAAGSQFVHLRLPEAPDPSRVIVTNGVQSALNILITNIVGTGGVLAVEEFTYPTIRNIAALLNIKVCSVAMDEEGMLPDAFETVCRNHRPSALYAQPTMHNPTTAVMSIERRKEMAEIARKYGVAIFEDDIYSLLPTDLPPPLSTYAPGLSWYVLGTAKSMAPAFKIAYLIAPSAKAATRYFWPGDRATYWMAAPINSLMLSQLVSSGGASRIIDAVRAETAIRQAMVSERLAGASYRAQPDGLQVWLTLPDRLPKKEFAAKLADRGISISTADGYYFGDGESPNNIRFGTGTPPTRAEFERGLEAITQVYRL